VGQGWLRYLVRWEGPVSVFTADRFTVTEVTPEDFVVQRNWGREVEGK
jgi:hypothetical protein